MVVALGVIAMTLFVIGWSKSTCSHCPTADCKCVGHPAGRRVGVDRRRGRRGGGDVGQRRRVRRRARRGQPAAGPCAVDGVGARRRIVEHPVERVSGIAGGPDSRRVVVDPAVVGLAGQWRVGDVTTRYRQARAPLRRRSAAPDPAAADRTADGVRRVAAGPRVRRPPGPSHRRRPGRGRPDCRRPRRHDRPRRRGNADEGRCR